MVFWSKSERVLQHSSADGLDLGTSGDEEKHILIMSFSFAPAQVGRDDLAFAEASRRCCFRKQRERERVLVVASYS